MREIVFLGDSTEAGPISRVIRKILERVKAQSPATKIYLQALFPGLHLNAEAMAKWMSFITPYLAE